MTHEYKNTLVTVKAYPEKSKKYGACICTAGITDKGEFIRLYPVPMSLFREIGGISKYTWISVECEKASEYLMRKESYKILNQNIKLGDHIDTGKQKDWKSRNEIILPLVSKSLEELDRKKDIDSTSLGIIKPKTIDMLSIDDVDVLTDDERNINRDIQMTLYGTKAFDPEKIPFIFRYHFKCDDSTCKGHKIMCEDWEMIESWRSWRKIYKNKSILHEKFINAFYTKMLKKDLYFFVGTHSKFNTWLIIGLYYPPKSSE